MSIQNRGYFESSKGTVILSNQRVIYLAETSNAPDFKNLNIPIRNFKNWKLEQPWFGANFVSGVVIPVQGGGLTRNSNLKITFTEGGAIEFTTILRNLLERIGESNEIPREYEPLPAYQGERSNNLQAQSPPSPHDDLPPQYSA
ncbi:hypothetical protein INT46_006673 [Mucor plumbeus]|uniref:GRAM domain-containing protein n=1 Tax=Mucor plumbeus TaxID=97098 RepID=A0A8H7QD74_9FUNG|nr:hypothetical protein INT46_006673 [Mucor plumbeus]